MSEHDDFKQNLLSANWRLYKTIQVDGARGPVQLDIRMPPPDELAKVLARVRSLKAIVGEATAGEEIAGQALGLEVIALTIWRPGAVRPLFTVEEVKAWPYASAVQGDCMAALSAATGVETAKGNSNATPR